MIPSSGITDNLCLRPRADMDTAALEAPVTENAKLSEAGVAQGGDASTSPPSADDQGTSLEDDQISIYQGDLLKLPAEIIDHIISFLSPRDLDTITATCRHLRDHGKKDLAWYQHVQDNVPGCLVKSAAPFDTYRELYIAHDPFWFLPKYKIWFCDFPLTGKIIIARYDPRRGCIEGYRLVAERKETEFEPWEHDDEVIIHSFEPKVMLHRDLPVIQLNASTETPSSDNPEISESRYGVEIPMNITNRSRRGTYSNIFLARPVEERPNMNLWPPSTIPARHRVRNASQGNFMDPGHKPQKRSEISNQTFRIRRWMEMLGHQSPGVRLAEEVSTYSTLNPVLYTPTSDKPYRGIWVGDYAGHGCEFLLIHQPDDEVPFEESSVVQREDETPEEHLARKRNERIYRGKIEAIKLTGDPNIPRGECTFVADDIGAAGFIRVAEEARFRGARIVKSKGHVAERLFRNETYIESQLILISPDRLAQFWVGFGHISFFERVRIDELTSPYKDRPHERPVWSGGTAV